MDTKEIARILLQLQAVNLSPRAPFTWASGLKAPLYCDNRLIISTVRERKIVIQAFINLIQAKFPQTELVAGTATAGIPHAAWIADRLDLPMVYVRSSEKQHGKRNQIEGRVTKNARVLVIEDLISTGGSSLNAVQALKDSEAEVIGIVSIFQYGFPETAVRFEKAGIAFASLTNLDVLMDIARTDHKITSDEITLLENWMKNPNKWSQEQS